MGVKFEKVTAYEDVDFNLPQRKTMGSAGYDFEVTEDIVIPSHYLHLLGMLIVRIGSGDSITKIEELSIVKDLIGIGESEDPQIGNLEFLKLKSGLPEVKALIHEFLNVDLSELKEIVKDADAKVTLVPTGVKAYLEPNQKLELFIRSSSAVGAYLMLANSVGLVDSDYVDNESNEGHIAFPILNLSPFNVTLKKGDVIGQGVISEFCKTDDDESNFVRIGGFGSNDERDEEDEK